MNIDKNKRNVLMAHLFVTSGVTQPDTSDSEITLNSIGTIDMVDYSVFDDFNYVALGHLHKPQYIGREEVRYCGSPVCYSRSEAPIYTVDTENGYNLKRSPNSKDKSMPFVEIDDAGNANIKLLPLEPKQAMKRIKGTLNDILKASEKDEQKNDFITPDLTDTNALDVLNPIAKLREVYPYATEPVFENITSYSDIYEKNSSMASDEDMEKSICELFRAFFEQAVNDEMTNEEIAVLNEIADKFSEKEGELK
jgi:exonuclease SbcD